jgi:glycosyltransferase involved in cell wall biosynthesis
MYNEQETVAPLLARLHEALDDYAHPWEVIIVDDGSSDGTDARLREEAARYGAYVRVVLLQRNFGQTAAMQAGIDNARGDVVVTLDGDLQNDPMDIPRLVQRLLDEDLDLVVGWRQSRHDTWRRRIASRLANRLIARVTGVQIHDYGCSLKVYRASVIKSVRLYGEMHRFIPAWMAVNTTPARIREEVVRHHPRRFGKSKYGLDRISRVLLDLLSVYFFMRFRARPGHFFGTIGLLIGTLGAAILGYLGTIKLVLGEEIGMRPLLLIGVLLVVVSVQLLTTGLMSELMARIYFESSASKSYIVREVRVPSALSESDWKMPGLLPSEPAVHEPLWS